ncbi:MAG: hypothetical protein KF889_21155 [Alphaproteobacteria bacterium]|nr:hypothetical protein [Alphaproteobacteria bacterium]MCW5743149.1 hypothetical protein [Alphaproteobacteria bacterium]
MTAASRLHMHARLHATQAAIGRVAALSPVQHGCLELSRAHRGGRSRWIVDIAIGGASRPAIIRAAVAVAGRHAAAVSGGPFAIVAHGEVAAALVDTKLPLFANAVEARRWVDARADGAAMQ